MKSQYFAASVLFTLLLSSMVLAMGLSYSAEAEEEGTVLKKENTVNMLFNEKNSEGSIDLAKMVEEQLSTPEECQSPDSLCLLNEVTVKIIMTKEWLRYDIPTMTDYSFANTVPRIENDVEHLTVEEVAILQEVLARRGLLINLDGSPVKERGYLGHLTRMAEIRLAQIKGLNPGDPQYLVQLRNEINNLLENMAHDESYVAKHPLPDLSSTIPQSGSPLKEEWDRQKYLAELAMNSKEKYNKEPPIRSYFDLSVDGYLNVEKVEE